jgi:predicted XRE-type DNA-binding protein
MKTSNKFKSVWDALEDGPVKAENMKLRSALRIAISEELKNRKLTQTDTANILGISQPGVSTLLKGDTESFRLDSLVNMAHRLGLHVSMHIAA